MKRQSRERVANWIGFLIAVRLYLQLLYTAVFDEGNFFFVVGVSVFIVFILAKLPEEILHNIQIHEKRY